MSDAVESKEKHPFYSRLRPQDGDRVPSYSRLPWWLLLMLVVITPIAICVGLLQPSARQQAMGLEPPSAVSSTRLTGIRKSGNTYTLTSDDASMTYDFKKPFVLSTMTIRQKPQSDKKKTAWQRIGFDAGDILTVTISTRVDGQKDYDTPVTQTLLSDSPQTETVSVRTDLSNIDSAKVTFPDLHKGDSFTLEASPTFNDDIPWAPFLPCIAIISALVLLLMFLRPSSFLSCAAWRNHRTARRATFAAMCVILCLVSLACTFVSENHDVATHDKTTWNAIMDPNQYQHVTDSMVDGQASLEKEPPKWLKDAKNPYDFEFRHETSGRTNKPYMFDYAFYHDKYYSYDGILPVLTLFLPYRLITGTNMSNVMAMAIMGCVATFASLFLATAIMRRFRPNATITENVIAMLMMWLCSCIPWLTFYPTVYHEVIIVGMTAAEGGLGLLMVSDSDADGKVRRVPLCIGSLLIGMTMLARPTLVLTAFVALPLFWHRFGGKHGDEREFFGKNKAAVINTLLVILPILAMAGVAMWWNWARFGNPLDFGYKYNLTGFDMVHKKPLAVRTLFGMFMYLFAPLNITKHFPFFYNNYMLHKWYSGIVMQIPGIVQEPYYGGLFGFFPFLVLLLCGFGKGTRQRLKEQKARPVIWALIVVALLIMAFDSMTAITQRYLADFVWLFCCAVIIVIAARTSVAEEDVAKEGNNPDRNSPHAFVAKVALLLAMLSFCMVMVNLLATDRYSPLNVWNPQVWWSCWAWFLGLY